MKGLPKFLLLIATLMWVVMAATFHDHRCIGVSESISRFKTDAKILAKQIEDMGLALEAVENAKPETVQAARRSLAASRIAYKRLEYLLEYFFFTSSRIYNRAPKNEIEEPYLEYQPPAGFQFLETMLFDSLPEKHRPEFREQIRLLGLSASNLNALLYQFQANDKQMLESVRVQLIRMITLGITGFDAPSLKTGIQESKVTLESIRAILIPYMAQPRAGADSLRAYLSLSIHYLEQNRDFDNFDRMRFLTGYALPLQKHLGRVIRNLDLEMNKYGVVNYAADHIFSRDALNIKSFPGSRRSVSPKEIELGKQLFFEIRLSGNAEKNCAFCHTPGNYFTDGLPKSIGFDNKSFVARNAPTLFYSGFQHTQFWDGRVVSLEDQIENVIKDPSEMNGNMRDILQKLGRIKTYKKAFHKAFGSKRNDPIQEKDLYKAIASYVRTLNPHRSPFDDYMNGEKKALTENQISGFNLFMGKAQCGTCHFAPLFNGLIPPTYTLTEFEILGTTLSDDLTRPEPDPDDGRFAVKPTPFYKKAFKTPTVRNAGVTGPYMHNGSFKTLETLIEFYNQGGGAGLGLDFPSQTLSAAKLNLTEKEKKDVIEFMHALTDDPNKP